VNPDDYEKLPRLKPLDAARATIRATTSPGHFVVDADWMFTPLTRNLSSREGLFSGVPHFSPSSKSPRNHAR
jgi:hypothetical protein